jgi:hypothetical protein
MAHPSRRTFFSAAGSAALAAGAEQTTSYKKPVLICAANGYAYPDAAWDALNRGEDTLMLPYAWYGGWRKTSTTIAWDRRQYVYS